MTFRLGVAKTVLPVDPAVIGVVMKKSRSWMVQIHLIIASLFLPLMLVMPLSGALYLMDQKGDQEKTEAFVVEGAVPKDTAEQEAFFREQFRKQNIDFDFEYIRTTETDFIFRPTSRVYFMAAPSNGVLTMYKVNPTWIKRMMEVHKGHGPKLIRWLEMAFGMAMILVALSGIWIAVVTPIYRRPMIVSFILGAVMLALGFI